MLIGIDASQAAKEKKTGVEYLASQLILNLKNIDHTNSYLLFTNKSLQKEYLNKNFKEVLIPFKKLWNKIRLPLALLKYKPEIFLEIGYMLPKFAGNKSICFVHDLASKHFPKSYSSIEKVLLNQSFKKAKKAKEIIFISDNTKNDYSKYYLGFKGKKHVIYPGYNSNLYKKIINPRDILDIKSKYILYLGRLEKRKNIVNLVLAYDKFCKKFGYEYKLVLAGKEGYGCHEIKSIINSLEQKTKSNIVLPGYVSENDLPHLYADASLFVFPSLYEGFGIPIVESMACGTPTICSQTSSLPEAGSNAVEYFDPDKPEEISSAMEKVLFDKKLQNQLIEKGFTQAKKFSYNKMAKEVLDVIKGI